MSKKFRCGQCFGVFPIKDGARIQMGVGGPIVWLCDGCLGAAGSLTMEDFQSLPKDTKQRIWEKAMEKGTRLTDTMERYPELYREV